MTGFGETGWKKFSADPRSLAWVAAARPAADKAIADPANAHWLQCEGTWFVGVNALSTAPTGAVGGVALDGPAIDAVRAMGLVPTAWDRAQVSVIHPGYPRPRAGETEAAFRYRRDRDAAHVDGLLRSGTGRDRVPGEFYGFILGLPLTVADADAAPFVVWEGSHRVMGRAFRDALASVPQETWDRVDVTEAYQEARRQVFETCRRVTVHAAPGEAYLVHRLALHGVAPWREGATADPAGRMIAYFRPEISRCDWIAPD